MQVLANIFLNMKNIIAKYYRCGILYTRKRINTYYFTPDMIRIGLNLVPLVTSFGPIYLIGRKIVCVLGKK